MQFYGNFSNFSDIKTGDNTTNTNLWLNIVDQTTKKVSQVRVTLKRTDMPLFKSGDLYLVDTFIGKDGSLGVATVMLVDKTTGRPLQELYKLSGSAQNQDQLLDLVNALQIPQPLAI